MENHALKIKIFIEKQKQTWKICMCLENKNIESII